MEASAIGRLGAELSASHLDGFVHFQTKRVRENATLRYFSGVSGLEDSGIVIGSDGEATLLVKDFEEGRAKMVGWVTDVRSAPTIQLEVAVEQLEQIFEEKKLLGKNVGFDESEMSAETYLRLAKSGVNLVPFGDHIRRMRMLKTDEEVVMIKRAVDLSVRSLKKIQQKLGSRMSEAELAAAGTAAMESGDGEKSFIHVQFGPNAATPHHDSDSTKVDGDGFLVVDLGARVNGYNADLTRTFAVGSPGAGNMRVMEAVAESLGKAIDSIRPGVALSEVARVARETIKGRGLQPPTHRIGHGIGLNVHESPIVEVGFPGTVEEGMVLAIEPGVYVPQRMGCRLESDVLVKDGHAEPLDVPLLPLT